VAGGNSELFKLTLCSQTGVSDTQIPHLWLLLTGIVVFSSTFSKLNPFLMVYEVQ
jgi:hypothetical protein